MPKDDRTAEEVFKRINQDARRGYCQGDVELDDIIDTELEPVDERKVRRLLRAWGTRHGIDNLHGEDQCT